MDLNIINYVSIIDLLFIDYKSIEEYKKIKIKNQEYYNLGLL